MKTETTSGRLRLAYGILSSVLILSACGGDGGGRGVPIDAGNLGLADFAYVNGKIYADGGWTSAVSVSDGHVLAVGDDISVRASLTRNAKVIDLNGKTVFPGLHDLHVHPGYAGKALHPCTFASDASASVIAAAVAQCAKQVQPGDWIFGGAWDKAGPAVKDFNRQLLDQAAPSNPVLLMDLSGHDGWANSRALAAGGFTKSSPDPSGGVIERDATGEPTGVLRESPAAKLRYQLPASSAAEATRWVKGALGVLASVGVTSIVDAAIRMDDVNAYTALTASGDLHQRVRGCTVWNSESPDFDKIFAARASYRKANFKLDCVKVFMDGTPNSSHSAAMLDPYELIGGDPSTATTGPLNVDPEVLKAKVTEWDKLGLIVKFHCGGDRALKVAMDAVAAARAANGADGPRHELAHVVFVAPEDMARAGKLKVALEYSPVFWYPGPVADDIAQAVGPERSAHIWPVKTGLTSGALVIAGSDWPGATDPNPWLAIETLVTRKAPGNQGAAFGGAEAITLQQAVDIYTKNAAVETGDSQDAGAIKIGARADLVVLDRSPFDIPIGEVHKIKTLRTHAAGTIIFDDGSLK